MKEYKKGTCLTFLRFKKLKYWENQVFASLNENFEKIKNIVSRFLP